MSADDGTDFSTQVHVVKCTWAPMAMSYHDRHLILSLPKVVIENRLYPDF
jgi:hypothetical protein